MLVVIKTTDKLRQTETRTDGHRSLNTQRDTT